MNINQLLTGVWDIKLLPKRWDLIPQTNVQGAAIVLRAPTYFGVRLAAVDLPTKFGSLPVGEGLASDG